MRPYVKLGYFEFFDYSLLFIEYQTVDLINRCSAFECQKFN